jgi:holin-like protein
MDSWTMIDARIEKSNFLSYHITMRFIKQLGIILAFAYAGDFIARFMPGRLPAVVIGMLLMLIALGLKLLKPEHINECADFLGSIMAFFFIPSAVTIIQNYKAILPVLWKFLFIGVVCTFFTFFVTYGTFRLLRALQNRKH